MDRRFEEEKREHQTPDKPVCGIFISPEASKAVKQCCAEYDLTFVG